MIVKKNDKEMYLDSEGEMFFLLSGIYLDLHANIVVLGWNT